MIGSGLLDRTGRPRESVVPPCSSAPAQAAWKVRDVKGHSSVSTPIEPRIVPRSELMEAIVSNFENPIEHVCHIGATVAVSNFENRKAPNRVRHSSCPVL